VPASFVTGPEFSRFRRRVLELADVEVLDLVHARENVFLDVQQDACFIVMRKRRRGSSPARKPTAIAVFHGDGTVDGEARVTLPVDGSAWPLSGSISGQGLRLADLGWGAGVGYLVANRQKAQLHAGPAPGRFPLVWAAAITGDGRFDHARGAAAKGTGWASSPKGTGVVRVPCVVVQRTSSRKQRKRVTAAAITADFITEHGGIIAENHVLVLRPVHENAVSPQRLADMLNAPEVSEAMNRACGSACIPAATLAAVPVVSDGSASPNGSVPEGWRIHRPQVAI
jgi:adenine-specific DNA-methyltransferase